MMSNKQLKCLTCYYYKNTEYIEPDDEHWKFSVCGNGADYACVCSDYGLYKPKQKPLTTVTGKTEIDRSKISPWNDKKRDVLKRIMDKI